MFLFHQFILTLSVDGEDQMSANPITKQLVTVWCKTFGVVNHTPNSKLFVREATQGLSSEKKQGTSFPQTTNHK